MNVQIEEVAAAIRAARPREGQDVAYIIHATNVLDAVAYNLAKVFARANPGFDAARFST